MRDPMPALPTLHQLEILSVATGACAPMNRLAFPVLVSAAFPEHSLGVSERTSRYPARRNVRPRAFPHNDSRLNTLAQTLLGFAITLPAPFAGLLAFVLVGQTTSGTRPRSTSISVASVRQKRLQVIDFMERETGVEPATCSLGKQ